GSYVLLWIFFLASPGGNTTSLLYILFAPRGGGWKETGDCDPLSLSNTSPDPLGDPLRRGITAAAVDRDFGFRYPVQIFNPHFDISFGYLCSGCDRLRFSRVVGLISFVFHYWGRGCSYLRLRGVLLCFFVGFALTANGTSIWRMKGRKTESYRSILNMV
ncbi:MAG: hypothetical protein PT954_10155, partial [Eubacteriales bacterium]|nr:hypothetical protein [Eubacteriales bacterium]